MANLYRQILASLRMNPAHKNIRIQIREQLDFASILYHKGLYKQSLRILDKAKELSILNEEKNLAFEIVELEKIIEAHEFAVGSVISSKKEVKIAVNQGYISLKVVQLPGKRSMEISALLNGFLFEKEAKVS